MTAEFYMPPPDPGVAVGMFAVAVAMRAKCKQVTSEDVDNLRVKAEELLDRDDPLFRAITGFATQYLEHRSDADQVAYLGRLLHDFVVGQHNSDGWQGRVDING